MANPVDPRVDYAFKRVFSNLMVLEQFLNDVFAREPFTIDHVTLLNPINERDFEEAKLSVVDIKAMDSDGRTFQVEIQLSVDAWLPVRMLFTLASVLVKTLEKGDKYQKLKPVYGIWVLGQNLIKDKKDKDKDEEVHKHHHFELYDVERKVHLTQALGIHTLELQKCMEEPTILEGVDKWIYLLRHGKDIDPSNPPEELKGPGFDEAWDMLEQISETGSEWAIYLSREDAMRQQLSVESHVKELGEKVAEQSDQLASQSDQLAGKDETIAEQSDQLASQSDQLAGKDETIAEQAELLAALQKYAQDPSAFSQEERQRLFGESFDGS